MVKMGASRGEGKLREAVERKELTGNWQKC
jgi:hypothetical protein